MKSGYGGGIRIRTGLILSIDRCKRACVGFLARQHFANDNPAFCILVAKLKIERLQKLPSSSAMSALRELSDLRIIWSPGTLFEMIVGASEYDD